MSLWLYSYESLETNDTSQFVDKEGFVDWMIGLAVLGAIVREDSIWGCPILYRFVRSLWQKPIPIRLLLYISVPNHGEERRRVASCPFWQVQHSLVLESWKYGAVMFYEMHGKTINDPNRGLKLRTVRIRRNGLKSSRPWLRRS